MFSFDQFISHFVFDIRLNKKYHQKKEASFKYTNGVRWRYSTQYCMSSKLVEWEILFEKWWSNQIVIWGIFQLGSRHRAEWQINIPSLSAVPSIVPPSSPFSPTPQPHRQLWKRICRIIHTETCVAWQIYVNRLEIREKFQKYLSHTFYTYFQY